MAKEKVTLGVYRIWYRSKNATPRLKNNPNTVSPWQSYSDESLEAIKGFKLANKHQYDFFWTEGPDDDVDYGNFDHEE
jgi:hypothetical protein